MIWWLFSRRQEPFVTRVLYVESGASSQHPDHAQVIREDTMAIVNINPGWVLDRVQGKAQSALRPETGLP